MWHHTLIHNERIRVKGRAPQDLEWTFPKLMQAVFSNVRAFGSASWTCASVLSKRARVRKRPIPKSCRRDLLRGTQPTIPVRLSDGFSAFPGRSGAIYILCCLIFSPTPPKPPRRQNRTHVRFFVWFRVSYLAGRFMDEAAVVAKLLGGTGPRQAPQSSALGNRAACKTGEARKSGLTEKSSVA